MSNPWHDCLWSCCRDMIINSLMGLIQRGETVLTLFMLLCSEVSILRGSQQAWTGAEPHTQLLPDHGRGRLGRSVVGHFPLLLLSIWVHWCLKMRPVSQHLAPVTLKWRGRPLKDVLCRMPFLMLDLCLTGIRSLLANGRRPRGKALSGTRRPWEMAVLLLSISTAT